MRRFFSQAWVWVLAAGCGVAPMAATTPSGWGVDALLSYAIKEEEVPGYLELLKNSGVRIVRERGTGNYDFNAGARDLRKTYDMTRAAGIGVAAFAGMNRDLGRTAWGHLPPDLRLVHEEGRRLGRAFAPHLDVWELQNEPELAWWQDMPEMYVAHHKALYLGLKAGAREAGEDTAVLFCSLGLPAGPWVERAARNGIMPYADAWNVHYYGEPTQFAGLIDGHVAAMRELGEPFQEAGAGREGRTSGGRWPVRREMEQSARGRGNKKAEGLVMPIWATEVGLKTVTEETWNDAGRRARQSHFIVETARQALAHPQVAAFMPFVLVHKNDGYAMTESAAKTWPAWDDYARFTRENPWPKNRRALAPERAMNPVVLQWLPDAETATGHKLAAAYRWKAEGAPIRGELRVYNFSDTPVAGRLRAERGADENARLSEVESPAGGWLTVPARGMLAVPLVLPLEDAAEDGRREWRQFWFEERGGRRSALGFATERAPELYPPDWVPLAPAAWDGEEPIMRYWPSAVPSGEKGGWKTFNKLHVVATRGALTRFEIEGQADDPEAPVVAAMRVPNGLPAEGWLRVAARKLGGKGVFFRVDLVDGEGRRFTIWENLGHTKGQTADAPRWMALEDFHPYAWGKLDTRRRLAPAEVREVQLRFFPRKGGEMVDVELGVAEKPGQVLVKGAEEAGAAATNLESVPVQ